MSALIACLLIIFWMIGRMSQIGRIGRMSLISQIGRMSLIGLISQIGLISLISLISQIGLIGFLLTACHLSADRLSAVNLFAK